VRIASEGNELRAGKGVLYAATGRRFVAEAEVSAASVKAIMPELPIALASDCGSTSRDFDVQLEIKDAAHSFMDKILPMKATPFDKTLYLDTDTFMLGQVHSLFDLLDRFDLAAAFEPARFLYAIVGVPESFPELNTGVILFNSCAIIFEAIDEWHRLYKEEIEAMRLVDKEAWHDQMAFTRMVFGSSLAFFVLPPEYNARILLPQQLSGEVKIVHSRIRNPDSYCSQLSFVNVSSAGPRVFNPNPKRIMEYLVTTFRLFRRLSRKS
jgi:hypothetical protein